MAAMEEQEVAAAANPQLVSTRKREPSGTGRIPSSPLGATARPSLPQTYNLTFKTPHQMGKPVNNNRGGFCGMIMTLPFEHQSEGRVSVSSAESEIGFTKIKPKNGKEETTDQQGQGDGSSTKSFIILGLIFLASIGALVLVYLSFPQTTEEDREHIKVPRDIEDAKKLGRVLSRYKEENYLQVLFGYFVVYIFLQSFAIPGSIFLSIIAGYLFPFPLALFAVCLCSAIGASFCYLLSFLVGKRLVERYLPQRAAEWSATVKRHRDHLLNYIIFLRITPFLPNWFINIVSPVINVPLTPFFMGTFLGVAPPSFVAIQAGKTLQKLTSSSDTLSINSILVLALMAVLSLLPVFFKRRLQQKFE